MAGSKPDVISQRAMELIKKFPDSPTKTLAKKLSSEFKGALTVDRARSRIRYYRGNSGKRKRKVLIDKSGMRPNQKAGWTPEMPESLSDPWEPFDLEGSKIGIISDLHIPYHDPRALSAAVDTCKKHEIDTLLLNGDAGDWYSISRWQKDPRKRNLKREIKLQIEGLAYLRGQFPKARIVYKNGNHEDRWEHFLWNHAPEVCDLDEIRMDNILKFSEHGIDWVKDERPVMAGKLPIFHGHELPKGLTNPVNMARGAFLRAVHTILVSHGHRTSGHAESDLWHDEIYCWSIGCLCNMRPQYARINKWNQGFAFSEVFKGGDFNVINYRISKHGEVRSS